MSTLLDLNEKLDEVKRLCEEGKSISEAIEIVKGYHPCDQTEGNNHKKNNFETIIAPGEGIDNGEIYDEDTRDTIRDLDYKGECICQK